MRNGKFSASLGLDIDQYFFLNVKHLAYGPLFKSLQLLEDKIHLSCTLSHCVHKWILKIVFPTMTQTTIT